MYRTHGIMKFSWHLDKSDVQNQIRRLKSFINYKYEELSVNILKNIGVVRIDPRMACFDSLLSDPTDIIVVDKQRQLILSKGFVASPKVAEFVNTEPQEKLVNNEIKIKAELVFF